MVVLGKQVREQFGQLGVPPEQLGQRLEQLPSHRLRRLAALDIQAPAAQLFPESRRGPTVPKAFSNLAPAQARHAYRPFVERTYGQDEAPRHASEVRPLRYLLHPRRSRAARMTMALARRDDLRERVGRSVSAQIVDNGRVDGVISIERNGSSPRNRARSASAPSLPPPPRAESTGTIWDIMMAMDQAILHEAARLGLGQGSGTGGTAGFLEAMGLWSLSTTEDDDTEWLSRAAAASQSGPSGSTAQGMTTQGATAGIPGTEGPENDNPSLDTEVMKLKRMIDKKTQMMELYSQTLSKYNQSANNIITNM
ncbi:MAG: hypothetical protein AAFZ18_32620, partial [Myxococcota bacterium]